LSTSAHVAVELTERPIRLPGSWLARRALNLIGWHVDFDGLPAAQGVAVVYPHTSNWDFPIVLLAKWAIGFPATWWGKDTLFRIPLFGRWLRHLGGRPVLRGTPQGAVGQMVDAMRGAREQGRFMWLALAPEGTRRRTEGWRSGFYRIAHGAGVPVGLVAVDFDHHRIGFRSFWMMSGHPSADFAAFAVGFAGCRGRHPALAAPVRPLEP